MEVDDEILGNRYEENELEGDFKSDHCCCHRHCRRGWRAGNDFLKVIQFIKREKPLSEFSGSGFLVI